MIIIARNIVWNPYRSRLPQMAPELNCQYRSTHAMASSSIWTRICHSSQIRHKAPSHWHVVPSTDDRGRPNTSWPRPTCPCYRRAEKRRANDLCNKYDNKQNSNIQITTPSNWRATTWCGTRTTSWTESRRILSNCSAPLVAYQYKIFYRQVKSPNSEIDGRRCYQNFGIRSTSRVRLNSRTTPSYSQTSRIKTYLRHV